VQPALDDAGVELRLAIAAVVDRLDVDRGMTTKAASRQQ
jgi:hypothetical protein